MLIRKEAQDFKNMGRTATLDLGPNIARNRWAVHFRVTITPKRWKPPHQVTFKIDIHHNRWAVLELHVGGPVWT